ncbi:MAG TPA: YkvA family protein [Candidatus Limnocylindrales bacterium]
MPDDPIELPPPPENADPFPRDRFTTMLHRLPNYVRLSWRLGRDPMLSKARRAAVVAAAGYVVSPVDLVPGIVPVLGQLDDLAFALLALRLALDGLHPDRRRAHLAAVGLEDAHIADDLRTIGATTTWIARSGLRLTGRMLREGGELTIAGAAIAGRSSRRAAAALQGRIAQARRNDDDPAEQPPQARPRRLALRRPRP